MKRRLLSVSAREGLAGYLFFLPWILGFAVFTLYPVLYSVYISLNEIQISADDSIRAAWQGLRYYYEALQVDTSFSADLYDALLHIVCATPVIVVVALVIALFLSKRYPLRTFFRSVFFLPVIIMSGPVISDLLGQYSLGLTEESPLLFSFMSALPQFLQSPVFFVLDNLALILWFSGVQILLFIAGLNKIGPELYEAASIDGASAWESFWKITMPHLKPFALLGAVYSIMEVANYANLSINEKIRSHLYEIDRPYSFSSAMSWIYFIAVLLVLGLTFLLLGNGKRETAK
ncbi:MAG: sugar ABC transporter permease [Oscillospiraceae bacterium]|jgi:ABC-type sugar transport system permease subunit|nr:sugar ABC transporter permease [Oscillospiraceae bacterium]